jgi:hypothetical protein
MEVDLVCVDGSENESEREDTCQAKKSGNIK